MKLELIMLKPDIKKCLQNRIDQPWGQFDYESDSEYYGPHDWLHEAALNYIKRLESDLDSLRTRCIELETNQ